MASLQEQLLKAGVVDEKKAKQITKEKRKKAKQTSKGQQQVNEARELVEKTRAEKLVRDREINRQQREAAESKAIAAQIKQLIDVNRIDRSEGEIGYQFTDGNKVRKIHITPLLQSQLGKGFIAIVGLNEQYELVPAAVAEKIRQRSEGVVVFQSKPDNDETDQDDPYADYKIPDDLMW